MSVTYCGKPLYELLGIWDGDDLSMIIRHKNRHIYLLSGDPALPYYNNCIRLDRTRFVSNGGVFLTIAPDSMDGFRQDCETRYTLKPIYRYELEHTDLSRFDDIPEEEWDLDIELDYNRALDHVDYVVTKNK